MATAPVSSEDLETELHLIRSETALVGVIAIHSTALGPAAGGCRLWSYASEGEAIGDAIRLARGMTFKNAMAGLPFGGGKTVLFGPSEGGDRTSLFDAVGKAVTALKGRYVIAEDVGTCVSDMEVVQRHTSHVAGLKSSGGAAGGDPSGWTALGVYLSMVAMAERAGCELSQMTVAVQGAGHVGRALCDHLRRAGATLLVADTNRDRAERVARSVGATVIDPEQVMDADVDILAPCALGSILDAASIERVRASMICGAANNQLSTAQDGERLRDRGILYAPDYVVNAGGIINVAAEYHREVSAHVAERVRQIPRRLVAILDRAERNGTCPAFVADEQARRIVAVAARKAA